MCSRFVTGQFLIILLLSTYSIDALICKGCLELDDLTFDRIVSKFSTVLVKFDVAFPYGKKHDEYVQFARELSESKKSDAIATIVGIKNYGQPTNDMLAERFRISNQLPAIKLFNNNDASKWIDYPYERNVTAENLRQFVRMYSNDKLAVANCLEQFDEYAAEFMRIVQRTPMQTDEVDTFLQNIRHAINKLDNDQSKQIAQIYLLIMKRILERDIEFIGAEQMRLQALLAGKISERNQKEIDQKLNVLSAFIIAKRQNVRNEL